MSTASTTYRFVPMSEEIKLKHGNPYLVKDKYGIEYAKIYSTRMTNFKNMYVEILLPVELLSPLSEEEMAGLANDWGIKEGISLMEGEAEAFIIWMRKNTVPEPNESEKWMTLEKRNLSFAELLAIFREEQKRKKEKP